MISMNHRLKNLLPWLGIILLGVLILIPFHDFQPPMASGDNGRDLYCFKKTFDGSLPYRDYWWPYGPLMPYYYSLFFSLGGITIKSVLAGELLLLLISGTLVFLILNRLGTLWLAAAGALWFWTFNPRFIYTYNHGGGMTCLLALIFMSLLYFYHPKRQYLLTGFFLIFLLGLIKINIGLANLGAFVVSVLLTDRLRAGTADPRLRRILMTGSAVILTGLLLIYAGLLHGLPVYYIRQCFQYLPSDQPGHIHFLPSLVQLVKIYFGNLAISGPNLVFGIIILLSAAQIFLALLSRKTSASEKKETIVWLAVPVIFWMFNLHEYLLSGVIYRLYWVSPIQVLLIFIVLYLGTRQSPAKLKSILYVMFLAFILLAQISVRNNISRIKVPEQYLDLPTGQVYVANARPWLLTVHGVTNYLNTHLEKGQTLLALPHEPLYYYLTGTDSPTRDLYFYEYINIPADQEENIIQSLKEKNTALVLISNRAHSDIQDLGVFGLTYGKRLSGYIDENYVLAAIFGDWDKPGGTFSDHAVKVYRKKGEVAQE